MNIITIIADKAYVILGFVAGVLLHNAIKEESLKLWFIALGIFAIAICLSIV